MRARPVQIVTASTRRWLVWGRLAMTLLIAGAFLLSAWGAGRASGLGGGPALQPAGRPEVVVLPTSGVVDDVMAGYIADGVRRAENDGAAALIVQLDTLGGAETSMQQIVQTLHARVPTIVWVGPAGAKAASAGTFITLAANLAYMAPSTNIGAASPISASGADIGGTLGEKVKNDAIAQMRAIAEERHPEAVSWAVSTVASANSYSASEAFAAHGINGLAASLDDVRAAASGQAVTVAGRRITTLDLATASVVSLSESPIQTLLHTLDDPNLAFIFLVLGVLAVLFELFHPTLLVGLLGGLSLVLSFYGSGSLPLNFLGVALVGLGIALLVLEAHVASHGLLAVAGIVSFVVGGVAFYGSPGPFLAPAAVAWPIIALMAAAAAAFGLIVVQAALRTRRRPAFSGIGTLGDRDMRGCVGQARTPLAPAGTAYVEGEQWSARTATGEPVPAGRRVRVLRQEGLTLIVEALD